MRQRFRGAAAWCPSRPSTEQPLVPWLEQAGLPREGVQFGALLNYAQHAVAHTLVQQLDTPASSVATRTPPTTLPSFSARRRNPP